jgi:hypothetical protein
VSPKEVKVAELHDFCTALAHDLMKNHEKRFADRMKSVREASTLLSNAGARLATGVKNAWGTMDKQSSEYGMRLAQILQENAQNLSHKEATSNFHNVEGFHQDAVKVLNEIILTVRRYAPKLRKMLKPEMTTLNSSLIRLERSIMDLGTALDASPGLKLESLQRDVQVVQDRQAELLRLKSEEDAERSLLEASSTQEKELQSREQELLSSPEFLELRKYESSLKLKEDETKQLLQPLIKPLLKLERAVAAKQGPAIDVKTLRDLLDSPIKTVVTGQRFAILQLLGMLEQTLAAGQLDMPERKRRKAEEAIQAVKQGALDNARDEYLALQANTQETLRQLKSIGLLDRRDELSRQLTETRSQIEAIKTRQKELQRRIDDMGKTVSKHKSSIESQISKISHESVTISTD